MRFDKQLEEESNEKEQSSGNNSKGKSNNSNSNGSPSDRYRDPPANPSPEDFPIYRSRSPRFAVFETNDGLELRERPDTGYIHEKKEWYSADWKISDPPQGIRKWWIGTGPGSKLRYHCHIVEEEFGYDFIELLKEDVEKACNVLEKAANQYNTGNSKKKEGDVVCAVCGEEHKRLTGDYRTVNNKQVCRKHTVEDLHHADLL